MNSDKCLPQGPSYPSSLNVMSQLGLKRALGNSNDISSPAQTKPLRRSAFGRKSYPRRAFERGSGNIGFGIISPEFSETASVPDHRLEQNKQNREPADDQDAYDSKTFVPLDAISRHRSCPSPLSALRSFSHNPGLSAPWLEPRCCSGHRRGAARSTLHSRIPA